MAGLVPTLTKTEFKNWVKGSLALLFTKEGLIDFVSTEIDRHHQHLLQLVPAANIQNKCACMIHILPQCTKTRSHGHIVPGPRQLCSRGVCNILMDRICKDHRFRGPSWKNTDPQKWCTDAFEIAKCFMAPDGYSQKSSLVETDFNGILSVVINNLVFKAHIQENLDIEPNICTKARDVGRKIRHTSDHLLSDSDLRDYIDDLINLLCDPACLLNDPSAQDAVNKLRMLKTNDITITGKDITEALKDNIRDTFSDEHRCLLQKLNDHYSKLQSDSVDEMDRILAVRKTELEEHAAKLTDDITRHAELKKHEIEQYDQMKEKKFEGRGAEHYGIWDILTFKEFRMRLEFKPELIRFYNLKESMIPASPLVEDHFVPLTELYVQPPMSAFICPLAFGLGNRHSDTKPVSSYRELLLNDDNVPYTNIYVEANAGYGKTAFTQKVAMTWCQAHKPNKLMNSKFKKEDLDALKHFDYLFLLHLRYFQGDTCSLDHLIFKFVSHNLSGKGQFSERFIAKILQTKTCLVIIDGLDEWVHPETCTQTPRIPHNNYRGNCTVLTTTRPWKLTTVGLPLNLIDRHVEIFQLDETASNKLKLNAVKLLNKNSVTNQPDLTDFDRKVSSVKLGDIRLIPYILLQLICIWFDGLSIGKSKCETFSNTIELTLQRGLNKENAPTLPTGNAERNVTVPECMRHNALCKQYVNLLLKLGKLAFYTLLHTIKESSLVIESITVLKFLTEQELEFCLKIGLIIQSKDNRNVSVKQYKVFFQHKYVQEFMAALYITSEWNNETIKSTLLEVCSSLSSILEMEYLFVFVCGMNPEVYTCISAELQKIVDLDSSICRYRKYMYIVDDADPDYNNDCKSMKSYQSMQLECLQESLRNGNDSCPIPLYFVLDQHSLTYDVKALKSIMQFNESNRKSPQISSNEKIVASMLSEYSPIVFMQSPDPSNFPSLETLRVDCPKELVWLADILTESAHTMKRLTLSSRYKGRCIYLSDISITALTGLTCLKALYLGFNVDMTHSNLKCLCAYISQTTTLTQLTLVINCSDHKDQYQRDCDVTWYLHRLNELKNLHLVAPCRELHVNPACLEKLWFSPWKKMTASASARLWKDLRAAPVLSSLTLTKMTFCREMIHTIPTLTELQGLRPHRIDHMIDEDFVIPRFTSAMTQLEHVVLTTVTMRFAAWIELLLSVGHLPHSVKVELFNCMGPSEEEWQTIVNVIKTTPTISLLNDLEVIDRLGTSLILQKQ